MNIFTTNPYSACVLYDREDAQKHADAIRLLTGHRAKVMTWGDVFWVQVKYNREWVYYHCPGAEDIRQYEARMAKVAASSTESTND